MKDIETVVRDANGEVLEVGDIVITPGGGAAIISRFYFDRGDYWIRFGNKAVNDCTKTDYTEPVTGDEIELHTSDRAAPDVTKVTSLTHDQYVPLARRTMDPDLTRRERISMLVLGAMGEIKELQEVEAQDPDTHPNRRDDLIEEVGDCYWYLFLLWDELGTYKDLLDQGYDRAEIPHAAEIAKKVIYHGKDENRLRRLVKAMLTLVGNCIYHNNLPGDGEIRLANIRKLMARYPDGFVMGGGER